MCGLKALHPDLVGGRVLISDVVPDLLPFWMMTTEQRKANHIGLITSGRPSQQACHPALSLSLSIEWFNVMLSILPHYVTYLLEFSTRRPGLSYK